MIDDDIKKLIKIVEILLKTDKRFFNNGDNMFKTRMRKISKTKKIIKNIPIIPLPLPPKIITREVPKYITREVPKYITRDVGEKIPDDFLIKLKEIIDDIKECDFIKKLEEANGQLKSILNGAYTKEQILNNFKNFK